MSFKTLLVHVEPTSESDARLEVAAALAHSWSATLIGVGGCAPCYIENPMLASADGEVVQILSDKEMDDLKDAEARFKKRAHALGARAVWVSARDYPGASINHFAAGADMIIASTIEGKRATTASVADLVMGSGIPVMCLPEVCLELQPREVLVAWTNTATARRAVSDALPVLQQAKSVTVACVSRASDFSSVRMGLREVIGRLARNGINAEWKELELQSGNDPCDPFLELADDRSADLIVSGAYGHSRMREWVLGGFTQGLLQRCSRPIMFSH